VAVVVIPRRVISYVKGPIEKYETAKVKVQDLSQTVSASGEVVAEKQVTLKFQTSGKLAWVGVKEGDQVKKWQAIASLDKEELRQTLKKELNDYMNERWDFDQDREDYLITSDDLDSYTLENDIRRILDKAQFDLNNKVIDVEIADLAIRLATLVTPIDGIVVDIEEPVAGVNITPATAEFIIADPSEMKFVANIDETDIGLVRLGQKVTLVLDAYEEEFEGEITKIAFSAVATSGGGTAFPIEIKLPENLNQKFKVGMNGDAEILVNSKADTLTVPSRAIKEEAGAAFVQVIEGREVRQVEVKTGLENDSKTEITEGLEDGQDVIISEKKKK
jgi:RND family efflux transporter MFP subunit